MTARTTPDRAERIISLKSFRSFAGEDSPRTRRAGAFSRFNRFLAMEQGYRKARRSPAENAVARRDRRARRPEYRSSFTPDRSGLADGGRFAPRRYRFCSARSPKLQWGDQAGKTSFQRWPLRGVRD